MVIHFVKELPFSKTVVQFNSLLLLFVLAVLANVAYCAAYVPDVFAQMSSLRNSWLGYRWVVFAVGLVFAAALTHFWSLAMFSHNAQLRARTPRGSALSQQECAQFLIIP